MKNSFFTVAAVLAFLLAACENQDGVTARIRFAAVKDAETGPVTRAAQAGGILIDSATISLQNIRLLGKNSNDQIITQNTVFPGPYLINLVTRKSTPVIESSSIAQGTYYGLNALLSVPLNTGYSIFVSGTYTLNDKWWRFYYSNSGSYTFQVTDSAGFIVDQQNPEIWIMIDVVSFFRGVDFSKAVVDNDNIIRINGTSNSSLAIIVQKNFTSAAEIGNTAPGGSASSGTNSSSPSSTSTSTGTSTSTSSSPNTSTSSNNSTDTSSGAITNPGSENNGNPGSSANSASGKDKNKDQDKNKDKGKEKNKSKQKDNNKSKSKDKDKDKNGH